MRIQAEKNNSKKIQTKSRTKSRSTFSRKQKKKEHLSIKDIFNFVRKTFAPVLYIVAVLAILSYVAVEYATNIVDSQDLRYASLVPTAQARVQKQNNQVGIGLPIRLKIPSIGISAAIRYMGLTPEGAMDVPSNQFDTGWYKYGPIPGKTGSAVIDGHIGFKGGAVFDNLHKLKRGDLVTVEDDLGKTITFVVRESRVYDFNAQAPEVFISDGTGSHLNLVTCTGVWDKIKKRYNKRLVIFTDIVR